MEQWIVTDPEILGGKPCIRGTRISVELILELFASGASRADVVHAYPELSEDAVIAALRYAARAMKNDVVWDTKVPA